MKFTPSILGARTGAVSITDNAPGSPHSVALSGTGVRQRGCTLAHTSLLNQLSHHPTISLTNIPPTSIFPFYFPIPPFTPPTSSYLPPSHPPPLPMRCLNRRAALRRRRPPPTAQIPTLSSAMLAAMAFGLALVGMRSLRRLRRGQAAAHALFRNDTLLSEAEEASRPSDTLPTPQRQLTRRALRHGTAAGQRTRFPMVCSRSRGPNGMGSCR